MGRQDTNNNNHSNDPTTVNSSIALLQERFRQLEKVKERREGKELLKLFSTDTHRSSSSSATVHFEASDYSSSLQPRLVAPHSHKPNLHDSLSLGLNMANKMQGDDHSTMKTSSNSNLWSDHAASTSRNFEHSDVDTSLHL